MSCKVDETEAADEVDEGEETASTTSSDEEDDEGKPRWQKAVSYTHLRAHET